MSFDLLAPAYLWLKWLHICAVIAWMAGMFYLPRLYVYHAERAVPGSEMSETFKIMERKLLRLIINPAMAVAWIAGLLLAFTPQIAWTGGWLHAKVTLVLILSGYHGLLARWRRHFAEDRNIHSGRFYRMMNEVPTLFMLVVVALVIFKPF